MAPIDLTASTFEQAIDQGIVLIDWWAPWCGPCRAFAPVFDAAAARHPGVVFGKIDTETEPGLAAAFGIRSIPTLMVLRDGMLLASQPGALPGKALDEIIRKVQALDMDEVRRSVEEQEREAPRTASAGGV